MSIDTLLRRPFIHGWELRPGIEQFAHHLSSALGLRPVSITWSPEISTAGINRRGSMFLAAVQDDARITRPALVRYVGFVVHELLHRKSTQFGTMEKMDGPGVQYRRALLNAVEDARIEREAIAGGLLGNVEGLLHDLLGQMVTEALASVTDWGDAKQYPFALAVALRDYPGLSCPMPAQVQRIATIALARMPVVTNTDEAAALAEWIYSELQAMEEDEPGQDDEQQTGQDEQQLGQDDEQQPGDQDGDQDGKGGQDAGQGDEGQGDPQQGPQGGAGSDSNEEGEQAKPKAQRPTDEAVEVEPTLGGRPENDNAPGSAYTRRHAVAPNGHHTHGLPQAVQVTVPARLRYELRRLFENTAQSLHLNNRKTGRLNPAALARHQVSDAIFRKRLDIEGIDSAVAICLDLSGSMYHEPGRITAAIPACYALADTLTAAGVNVAVVTFDRQASVAVPFDSSRRTVLDTITRIKGGAQFTDDWYALRLAHDLLLRCSEPRKVCFFISDGCGMVDEMRTQVKAGTNLGITTLGVGIQLEVSNIYGERNSILVRKPQDLGNAAFSRMKLAA